MKVDNDYIQRAIIAREIIDLYRDSQDKIGTAVSLDVLCFAMARLTGCDKDDYPTIDWDDLASNFDGIATSQASDVSAIRKIENDIASTYKKSLKIIKQQLSSHYLTIE
jgi:hypothetical protein